MERWCSAHGGGRHATAFSRFQGCHRETSTAPSAFALFLGSKILVMIILSIFRHSIPALLIVAATISGFSAPVISSITPSTGDTQGGNLITIVGTGFGLSPEIWVGSNEADPSTPPTDTLIIAEVPEGEGVDLPVTVVAGGVTSNSRPYSYLAPVIQSITPASSGTEGGTQITINGSSFGSNPTATLGGVSISKASGSHSQFVGTLPAGQGTNLPIVVRTSGGRMSNSVNFSYSPPSITSVSPTTGSTSGGTVITLTGNNFGLTPSVTVNNSAATLVSTSHNSIQFILPPGQGTNASIAVQANGQSVTNQSFSYAAPLLSDVTAASRPTAGGVHLTLTGSNFGISPLVTVGGNNASIVGIPGHTQIIAMLPPGEGVGKSVTVVVAGQTSNSRLLDYDAPSVTEITAASIPTSGNVPITIRGLNFGLAPTATVGGSTINVTSSSHTQIVGTLPAGQGINRPLIVTAALQVSTPFLLSYDPPVISSITPTNGPSAGGTTITLTGSSFGLSPTVTLLSYCMRSNKYDRTGTAMLL
jgi:hypothetical protein